jgi:hypothetical protein
MAAGLDFEILTCRYSFLAREPIAFGFPAANRFRGYLGFQLPEPVFRPTLDAGPSGLHDRPRPFTVRAYSLDGRTLHPGQPFSFDLHLFWTDPKPFHHALRQLPWAELTNITTHHVALDLSPRPQPCAAVHVRFLSATELKPAVLPGELPAFHTLACRLRDRISALRATYGPGPLEMDFATFGRNAEDIITTGGELRWHNAARSSQRTGQTHPLGGFTGHVDYAGPLAPYLPWLEAGFYSGVGRQTVWGKGIIQPAPAPR